MVFGSANHLIPNGWLHQSFKFHSPASVDGDIESQGCSFGLIQNNGGPCGILAAVQAHILKVSY